MLHVLMQGRHMGRLGMDDHGHPHFAYDPHWLASDDAFPLSISLPLNRRYVDANVDANARGHGHARRPWRTQAGA